ncbi:GGDEF domain-containing protein [Marinobacterium nitratireducens]|uniref:GGDEF domain-containing protein n=1 Tax=Marinobacterium nitratireducens TaxID=518897 RepID=A0A918DMR5_9GAMM|nr:EAL domain-containing protein [Marinobacterium nitratireducens]GGO75820.1 GGDEF domain-containing protein [Marinobacterium nitratireducens]
MSLVNQLIAAILAVMLGLTGGTLYIVSDQSKRMLTNQLESHALDTATHLGLYLAPYIAKRDRATVETTVNAIFDSGFYARIDVVTENGETLFSKSVDAVVEDTVPQWFVNLVEINPPSMQREVTFGWSKTGSIFVKGHPGYAYEAYWKTAKVMLVMFVLLALGATLLITSLVRLILRPLKRVEQQAQALSEKRYIEQPRVPHTRELRRVVLAMNQMVRQVHQMFEEQSHNIEELRRSAYQDELTGLPNARATQAQLGDRLDQREDFGPCTLLYLRIGRLQELNRELGQEKTNNFIRRVAEHLRQNADSAGPHIIGRLTGADFVLLIRRLPPETLHRLNDSLLGALDRDYRQLLQGSQTAEAPVRLGIAHGSDRSHASQLLANARLALEEAERTGRREQHHLQQEAERIDESWQQHVATAIGNRQIFLQAQPVLDSTGDPLHKEVFARILNRENEPCSAGEFISVVRELGLMVELDRAVVEHVLSHLQSHRDAIAINLSNEAVQDLGFHDWLLQRLSSLEQRERFCIEINETSVLNNLEGIEALRSALQTLGCPFGVDNFGVHPSGFGYLYRLQPDYIKIDGSLSRGVDEEAQDRFFVSSLISVAHSLDIRAYAERIERQSQLDQLLQLKVDGAQGYLHGAPTALD